MMNINRIVVLVLLIVLQTNGEFFHMNVNITGDNKILLDSSEYPSSTSDWDVIWSFAHSIQIETLEFSLDGQRGDFLLISDLPLLYGDSIGNDTDLPDDYGSLIASDSLTLMSWESNATSVRVLTKHGAFIHFHREKRADPSEGPDSNFKITVQNLDFLRIPSTTVAPETTVTTPQPNVEVYLTKFLSCVNPQEFIVREKEFKTVIAEIASEYCARTSGCMEIFDGVFLPEEVNVPDDGGLYFCDPLWPVYATCVEVTFAVVRSNESTWLMPQGRLNEMWEQSGDALREEGFCPYDPPAPLKHLNAFVWVASSIGLLLVVMIFLCAAWIWNEPDNGRDEVKSEDSKSKAEEIKPMAEVAPGGGGAGMGRFFDHDNPIVGVLRRMQKGADDSRYLEVKTGSQSSGYNTALENANGNPLYGGGTPSKVKQNAFFQEQEVTFAFNNPSFQPEEEEEEEHYGFTQPGQRRSPNEFLSIERDFYDERSDTEI